MRKKILMLALGLLSLAALSQSTQAQQVIDDFATGPYKMTLRNGQQIAQQSGESIVGGVRQTVFTVGPDNTFHQPTELHIHPGRPMIINAGFKSPWGLYLVYGVDINGQPRPLDLSLADFDRIRVHFDAADLSLSMAITVYSGANSATLSKGVDPDPSGDHFHIDFPRREFSTVSAHRVNWRHIDTIVVLIQAGTPIRANDLGVNEITATNEP